MIVATSVTFYEQNRKRIVNLNRQQRTRVSRTKCTHCPMQAPLQILTTYFNLTLALTAQSLALCIIISQLS